MIVGSIIGIPVGSATSGAVGNVDGPASSTANAIARYNGTTGKLLKNSSPTISDAGNIGMAALATVDGRDVSVDGAALDTAVTNIAANTASIATKANRRLTLNAQSGTSYTLQASDANETTVEQTNAAAIATTIPVSTFVAGDVIVGAQGGAGQVTLAIAGGVGSLLTPPGRVAKTLGQNAEWCLKCLVGGATPTFRISGDLAAS